MENEIPSQTPEYLEAEKHCDKFAAALATQILSRLNNATFDEDVVRAVSYPRQLVLEKVVKILTDKI